MKPIYYTLLFLISSISSLFSQFEITEDEKRVMAKYTHPVHDLKDQLGAPPYPYRLSDFTFQTKQDVFLIRKLKEKNWGESRSYLQFVFHEDKLLSSRTDVIKDKNLELFKYENNELIEVKDLKKGILYVKDPDKNIFHQGGVEVKSRKIHFEKNGNNGKNLYFSAYKELIREVTFENNKIISNKLSKFKRETLFEYDSEGRLNRRIEIKNIDKSIPDTTFIYSYLYDSLGFLIRSEKHSFVNKRKTFKTYEYKFESYLKKLPELIIYTKNYGKSPARKESYFFDEHINLIYYGARSSKHSFEEVRMEYKFKY